MVPYSTCDEAASLVVQMIVVESDVILLLLILDIAGAVVSGAADVVKVKFPDEAIFPAASVLFTR